MYCAVLALRLLFYPSMKRFGLTLLVMALVGGLGVARCHHPTPSAAEIHLPPGIVADADRNTAREVVAAFERADAAVHDADLEALMPFYATGYNYYGLKRADVRRIWSEVFAHYRDLTSRHVFTEVKLFHTGPVRRAAVTCTGGLYGIDRESGKKIAVDSWANEIHYLIFEDGAWRFLGNASGLNLDELPPSSAPHHPLF